MADCPQDREISEDPFFEIGKTQEELDEEYDWQKPKCPYCKNDLGSYFCRCDD